jgi:YD repeat-containing protein
MRLALGILFAATAFGQVFTTQIDCGQSVDISFSPDRQKNYLAFSGDQGEVVLFRFVLTAADSDFRLSQPVMTDQYGNPFPLRGGTPSDLARQSYEFDVPAINGFTFRLQSANPNASATIHVTMLRLTRPCNRPTLSCGKTSSGSITSVGQMDMYQYPVRKDDVVALRLLRLASGGTLDPTNFFIAVYGADGHVINSSNGAIPSTSANGIAVRTDVKAPADGVLTVLVWEATGTKGGPYYLSGVRLNGGCGGPGLTCSSVVEGQLNTPLTFASYTLPATQGDVYQMRVARADTVGTFTAAAEVYDPQGNRVGLVPAASPNGHAASTAIVPLPANGSYSVLVSGPVDGSAGTFTLTTTRINRPCTDQTVACSAIFDGSISGVLRNKVYSLTASANDTFLIRLLKVDPAAAFRPRLDIYDAAGNQIQSVTSTDLTRVNFTAPADGAYTMILSDNFDSAQSGSYALSVMRLNRPCEASPLTCGGVVAGTIARSLAAGVYTYAAAAGESFSVRMLGGAGGVQPSIEVYDDQGAPTGSPFSGASSGMDVVKPKGGTYTVVAVDNNKTPLTGSFTMELLRTKNACAVALPQGQTTSGVISASTPYMGYTLSAAAGDTLSLRSASSTAGFNAQIEVYDPDGQRLDAGVFGLTRKLTSAGTYTVLLGAAAARTAGGYTVAWQLLNKPAGTLPLKCGGATSGVLTGTNQFRYYSAAADAGDTLRLIFTRNDNFNPTIEIFDPLGARIAANSDVLQKVTAGGNYLVMVSPSTTSTETGAYTIAYQRPNNPCSPVALTCGQSTLQQVGVPGQLDTFAFNATAGDLHNIRLVTRSGNYSPFAELYNAAGSRINTSSTGQIRMVLPADGLYSLLVRDRGAVNLGSYRVSLQDDSATCQVDDHEAPSITLVRPTGGEVLPGGTTFRIQWVSDDNVGVASHDIALSTDGGKTFGTTVASGVNGNAQAYDWILSPDVAPSRTAVVKITATDAAGNTQSASSDLVTLIGSGFNANASATYVYDALNRITQATLADGRVVTYTWDAAGNLLQITVSGQ